MIIRILINIYLKKILVIVAVYEFNCRARYNLVVISTEIPRNIIKNYMKLNTSYLMKTQSVQ